MLSEGERNECQGYFFKTLISCNNSWKRNSFFLVADHWGTFTFEFYFLGCVLCLFIGTVAQYRETCSPLLLTTAGWNRKTFHKIGLDKLLIPAWNWAGLHSSTNVYGAIVHPNSLPAAHGWTAWHGQGLNNTLQSSRVCVYTSDPAALGALRGRKGSSGCF